MTLKFNSFFAVDEAYVIAKFHGAKCSGLWVIIVIEKQTNKKT